MYRIKGDGVIRLSDNAAIPNTSGNRDWQLYQKWLAEGNTPEPEEAVDPLIAVRSDRNRRLTGSDWTQMSDTPLTDSDKSVWAAYRQELRDVTEDFDPDNFSFPAPPVRVRARDADGQFIADIPETDIDEAYVYVPASEAE